MPEEGHIPPRGDDATFSWTNFDKDVDALKKLGVNHYRFGIEWGRVEPKPGVFNERPSASMSAWRRAGRPASNPSRSGHFTFPIGSTIRKRRTVPHHPDVEQPGMFT